MVRPGGRKELGDSAGPVDQADVDLVRGDVLAHEHLAGAVRGELIDAQQLSRAFPTTFAAPSLNEVAALAAGDLVKLGVEFPPDGQGRTGERFWVIVSEVDAFHERVASQATVVMPLKTQFYAMREFAITDPDGHILTFAQRVGGE